MSFSSRKKILICGSDVKQRLKLLRSLRSSFDLFTESEESSVLRVLRKRDIHYVFIVLSKRRIRQQMRLTKEINTEEKNPPIIFLIDPYFCLPNPRLYVQENNIGGYVGGRKNTIDFVDVINENFHGQKPVIIGKASLRDKIWKRIRS